MTNIDLVNSLPILAARMLVRFAAAEVIGRRAVFDGKGLRFPLMRGMQQTIRLGAPFFLFIRYKILGQQPS